MKIKSEAKLIILLEGLKQFMELFSGPFLITYFVKLSADSAVTISVYNIICDIGIAAGSYFVGKIIRNKYKLAMYRLGIFTNLIYIVLFIVLADRIIDFIPVIAIVYGISAACYWYPINLLKSVKVSDEERPSFFAGDRIVVTAVAVIGPVILGTMISKLDYRQTAYVIAGVSAVQLVTSFVLKPVPAEDKPPMRMREAWGYFIKDRKFKVIMTDHFCEGFNINGGALGSIAMISVMNTLMSDQKVGYVTSTASLLVILGVAFFRKRYKDRDPKYFIYACGIIPILVFFVKSVTGMGIFTVIFYIVYYSLSCIRQPVHDVYLYSILARGNLGENYREEYFAICELVLGVGRICSYLMLITAALIGNSVLMDIVTWIMVLTLFVNSWFINHFEEA